MTVLQVLNQSLNRAGEYNRDDQVVPADDFFDITPAEGVIRAVGLSY